MNFQILTTKIYKIQKTTERKKIHKKKYLTQYNKKETILQKIQQHTRNTTTYSYTEKSLRCLHYKIYYITGS